MRRPKQSTRGFNRRGGVVQSYSQAKAEAAVKRAEAEAAEAAEATKRAEAIRRVMAMMKEEKPLPEIPKPRRRPDLDSATIKVNPPEKKRTVKSGTGRDITKVARNMRQYDLDREREDDELRAVDPEDLREAIRPLRPGEALYNSLVKQKKRKAVPKSVRKRIKKMHHLESLTIPEDEMY